MNENEKIKYWIDISEYDLETAAAMHHAKRFLYVGFMCHQAIEKILKAYYSCFQNETPPYTHNLTVIAERAGLYDFFSEEQRSFIDFLEPLNIKARYPTHREQILK